MGEQASASIAATDRPHDSRHVIARPGRNKDDETIHQFLRLCLCARWDSTALETARTLSAHSALDWDTLCQTAQDENLIPLLYQSIRDRNLFPSRVEQDLRLAYYHQARDNLVIFQELEDVLHHLQETGIPVLLLKGAALIKTVYDDNLAVRPMHDVDLLVRKKDTSTVVHQLAALGYKPVRPEPRSGNHLAYEHEVRLCKIGREDVPLSIHWSLFDSPHYQQILPIEWFWQTASSICIGNTPSLSLGPEAQILHLCGHLSLHHGGQERQVLRLHDVAAVLAFYEQQIDWDQILAQAQACDLVLPVQQILTQVVEEWFAPIPVGILERLRSLHPSPNETRVFDQLAATRHWQARRLWADLVSMPSWGQRLRYAWHHLFPSPGYMQHRYRIPYRLLMPLFYPYRWFLGLRSALGRKDR